MASGSELLGVRTRFVILPQKEKKSRTSCWEVLCEMLETWTVVDDIFQVLFLRNFSVLVGVVVLVGKVRKVIKLRIR